MAVAPMLRRFRIRRGRVLQLMAKLRRLRGEAETYSVRGRIPDRCTPPPSALGVSRLTK